MKTIELTDEQYEKLCSGEDIIIKPPNKKWIPHPGSHAININGTIYFDNIPKNNSFGNVRDCKRLADAAAKRMITNNLISAYVDEMAPSYAPNWNDSTGLRYTIGYSYPRSKYVVIMSSHIRNLSDVYMPKEIANELCEKLNSGEVDIKFEP